MTGNNPKSLTVLAALLMLTACETTSMVEVRPSASSNVANIEVGSGSYYNLGKTYLASSDYGLAIGAFRRSLMHEDNEVAALNGLAITYDMLGRFDLSQKYYEQALEAAPDSPVTYSNLAYSQHLQGENVSAVQLAGVAEQLLDGQDEKTADAVSKAVTGNIQIAEMTKQVEEKPLPAPEKYFAVERVSDRSWEVVHKAAVTYKKPQLYKASYSVESIIAKAAASRPAPADSVRSMPEDIRQPERPLTYRILNGTGRPRMASRMAQFLGDHGQVGSSLGNAAHYGHAKSVIKFTQGHRAEAERMAKLLPVSVKLVESDDLAADVILTLGNDLLAFDTSLYQRHFDI